MLKELDGKGSYCSLVMAVVVVKDVLLFAAFAVNIEAARAVGAGQTARAWERVGLLRRALLLALLRWPGGCQLRQWAARARRAWAVGS